MNRTLKNKRILIIDDEPDSLNMLLILLERHGAKVFFAQNGQVGFNIARTEVPDLILADIFMPEVDGWELINLIKEFPPTSNIPVIAITAHSDFKQRALGAGFQYFVGKPIQPTNFMDDLQEILA